MSHPVSTVAKAETKVTPNSTVAKAETKMTPDSTVANAHPAIYASLAKAPIEIPSAGETFSSLLKSKIVAVTLKTKEGETTYHLHSSLLCRESKRFLKDLTWLGGLHKEASNLTIDLVDESEFHFMSFVAYLYGRFVPPVNDATHMIRLAELYAMAERFMADGFAKTLEDAFISKYSVVQYTSQQIYDLLHIAYDFITQRNPEDQMRDCIFHLAASKLTKLRLFDPFRNLLHYDPELAVEICLRVGGTPDRRKLNNTPVDMQK